MNNAHPNLSSAAASTHGAASPSLELLEARQVRDSLKSLLRTEQSAMADFLVALADFDRRRGWEALGHASLFAFLRVELKLTGSSSFWRMSAARLLQRFPDLAAPLRDGRLCLTTAADLARVLTEENRSDVLPRFYGTSSRESKELVAELLPQGAPATRAVVTSSPPSGSKLSAPQAGLLLALRGAVPQAPNVVPPTQLRAHEVALGGGAPAVERPAAIEPLTADLRRLHVTVSKQFLKKLDAARDGLSHSIVKATAEQVLEAALDLLLEKQAQARGQAKRPRRTIATSPTGTQPTLPAPTTQPLQTPATTAMPFPNEPPPHRRDGHREAIPAAVRRAVWERDSGRCSWPLDGGGHCSSTHRLELDHVVPWADWGGETEANLRLVCAAHNRLAARRAFGERTMSRYGRVREAVAEYGASANWGAAIRRTAPRSWAHPEPAHRETAGSGGSPA
jgi:hypothetical protein